MLEKARLKGKKGQLNNSQQSGGSGGGGNTGAGAGNDEEFEDDGLCCTCGQKVGQHNHVPANNGQQKSLEGVQGQGPGPGKQIK
jgi:hypothetical protein